MVGAGDGHGDNGSGRTEPRAEVEIHEADLAVVEQGEAVMALLAEYAVEPGGGRHPLPASTRERLIRELRGREEVTVLLARARRSRVDAWCFVGVAVCMPGFSTFAARPLLNIHDLAVTAAWRGHGIGGALIEAAAELARARGCCRLTLEVLEGNVDARRLYERSGFGRTLDGEPIETTFFMTRPLEG